MDKKIIKSYDMTRLSQYVDQLREHPRLSYLFLELTSYCNLHCSHCGSSCSDSAGMHMDTEMLFPTLHTITDDFDVGSVMICVTGGEPMLHPKFKQIISKIVKLGFPWGMITNGTLITDAAASFLKEQHIGSITV